MPQNEILQQGVPKERLGIPPPLVCCCFAMTMFFCYESRVISFHIWRSQHNVYLIDLIHKLNCIAKASIARTWRLRSDTIDFAQHYGSLLLLAALEWIVTNGGPPFSLSSHIHQPDAATHYQAASDFDGDVNSFDQTSGWLWLVLI